jgi:DNA (cytosine-5)-methyltransferase 1
MELIIDNFAGGGGASTGIELALGRSPDMAINHCAKAVAMHAANHPHTVHIREDVFQVDPVATCAGRPVGLAWFSPDCKHFSKAKGGKPRSKKIRGLAWVMVKWCATVRPRVCVLENVEEFKTWGPLLDGGQPCPQRKGHTFKSFIKRLQNLGYQVEWRELRACDYGAPTIRKRLFLIARCDGVPITWPEPTHGRPQSPGVLAGTLEPWRTAAECIDWGRPCHSIFLTREQGRAVGVNRPLAEATMRRIARGLKKFVLDAPEPFIVRYNGERRAGETGRDASIHDPLPTQTTENRFGLVSPYLTEHANASNPRSWSTEEPMRTQCAGVKGGHFALCAAYLDKRYGPRSEGETRGCEADGPLHTVTTGDHHQLCTAFLSKHFGGTCTHAATPADPMPTVTAVDHNSLIQASFMSKLYGTATGAGIADPSPTVTSGGNHLAEVRAFLVKYYGNESSASARVNVPMHTVTTRDRIGVVTVAGEEYSITDLGLRMLEPRELFNAQGFPARYLIDPIWKGKPMTKGDQVRMCGNSVPPPMAAALIAANVPELKTQSRAA